MLVNNNKFVFATKCEFKSKTWFDIGKLIFNLSNGSDKGYRLWLMYSRMDQSNFDEAICINLWDAFDSLWLINSKMDQSNFDKFCPSLWFAFKEYEIDGEEDDKTKLETDGEEDDEYNSETEEECETDGETEEEIDRDYDGDYDGNYDEYNSETEEEETDGEDYDGDYGINLTSGDFIDYGDLNTEV